LAIKLPLVIVAAAISPTAVLIALPIGEALAAATARIVLRQRNSPQSGRGRIVGITRTAN